ncbi:MAG: ATP-binding protein [Pseudomonadales bacterium]
MGPTKKRLPFETRLLLTTVGVGLPAVISFAWLLWAQDYSVHLKFLTTFFVTGAFVYLVFYSRNLVVNQLKALGNIAEAVKIGDYSLRGRRSERGDDLDDVYFQLNSLSEDLQRRRYAFHEAEALLGKIVDEIEVGIFVIDQGGYVSITNRAAGSMLNLSKEEIIGRTATELGLDPLLDDPSDSVLEHRFHVGSGPWHVRVENFREAGRPQRLLVVTDLKQILRREELKAWRRLIRVISHEVNNSLTPIISMCRTLTTLLGDKPLSDESANDAIDALEVMRERSDALKDFIGRYAELARLPEPTKSRFSLRESIESAVTMSPVENVSLPQDKSDVELYADRAQIEQVLINLFKNAHEASNALDDVRVEWDFDADSVTLDLLDHGKGISNPANLFIPFYSTKQEVSGIGLVLSRQIIENHHGSLTLENRKDTTGCVARIRLPRA